MDELDLELAARLRTEPAPDAETVARHHRQLESAIQAAVASGPAPSASVIAVADADGDDVDIDADLGPVGPLVRPSANQGRPRRSRRRVLALAAAVVAVVGGLFAATRIGPDPGEGTATEAPPATSVGCGTELPFTFPAPAGYEGPLPGPSEGAPAWPDLSPDTLLVHWQSADAAIDVRWPSFPPLDPTTPVPEGVTDISEHPLEPQPTTGGRWVAGAVFYSLVIGPGECSGFDLTVTSSSAVGSEAALDQVEMALAGPGGPLAPEPSSLVTDTTSTDALPSVPESDNCEEPNVSGTVDGAATYATAREALAFYLAAEPILPNGDYQEIALPDGSFGYAMRPRNADGSPAPAGHDPTVVLHVVARDGGWAVASYEHTSC